MHSFSINGRHIGPHHKPYIIAELSANHNGDLDRALSLISQAKSAGADAIKIQTYTADTITINHNSPDFVLDAGPWSGQTLYDLYSTANTPWEWHPTLFQYARDIGITIFSSPFDTSAVDFLSDLGSPAYKVASFELVDLPLIRAIAKKNKPIIMSTGMSSISEVKDAVACAQSHGTGEIALLHCISAYPTSAEQANLRNLIHLSKTFDLPVGLSDHCIDNAVSIASIPLGACIIEKHFTESRSDPGPDTSFSIEPDELTDLVQKTCTAWLALGSQTYTRSHLEQGNIKLRRSLYVVEDVAMGEPFTVHNVRSIRPGYGLPPKYLDSILGLTAPRDLKRGTPLTLSELPSNQ